MKGKIFPIIFTTLIASLLFFGIMYKVSYTDTEFAIQKLEECDKTYDFEYKLKKETITKTYNYKIQDEKAIIVELVESGLSLNSNSEDLYPTTIEEYPVTIERYKTFNIQQLGIETAVFATVVLVISLFFFKFISNVETKMKIKKQERIARKQEKQNNA